MTKCFDKAFSSALNNGGVVTELNNNVVGTGFFNRVGNGSIFTNIHLKGALLTTSNAAQLDDYVQLALVHDSGNIGAAVPAITTILGTTNAAGATNTTALSGINWNNRDRFSYIWKKTICLPSNLVLIPGPVDDYSFRVDEELRVEIETMYLNAAGTIVTGNIYFVAIGLQNPGTEPWQFLGEARMHFDDA